jgi:glycosyltransferase involved in cell wall biosynthesis
VHRWIGKRHPVFLDPFAGKRTGSEVTRQLRDLDYDVLLTNDMAIGAFTQTRKPVVIYTDVMISRDYAEKDLPGCRLGNMSALAVGLCRKTLRRALRRSSLVVFPAEWSANAARAYCGNPEKIKVIPFGANVEDPGPEIAKGRAWKEIARKGRADLLFVGKDWMRKGGDVAVEAVRQLNMSGFKAVLHVVGARVPGEVSAEQVLQYGLLDKSNPGEMELLKRLFEQSDAFILPSWSEGYVISVLEAAAYGLPVLAYDADGVRQAVVDGHTGLLFPLGSPGSTFAEAIRYWQRNPEAYEALAKGARRHYETTANWRSSVLALMECIESVVNGKPAARQPEIRRLSEGHD